MDTMAETKNQAVGPRMRVMYLGLDFFPFGLAETQRAKLLSKALLENGCDVSVVSRWWCSEDWDGWAGLPVEGTFEGIHYINASGTLTRPSSWTERKIRRLWGIVHEFWIIHRLRRSGDTFIAILSTQTYFNILYYTVLSRILGFSTVLNKVEYYGATIRNPNVVRRANAFLLDQSAPRLVDGVLPISSFLVEKTKEYAPGKPWLRVPILVDQSRFRGVVRSPDCRYLLFAGYLAYLGIVQFILNAFDVCGKTEGVSLYLVVNGSQQEMAELEKLVAASRKRQQVRVFSKLTDGELSQLYVNSYALLIPLRPTVQDTARFPHKIGEYCASGRPIVTTNVGEVKSFFVHKNNAFIAEGFDEYANVLDEVLSDPSLADAVGAEGRLVAETRFNYQLYGPQIRRFFEGLSPNGAPAADPSGPNL
jgi:glycosyltransferase involved in cell wall biosynthesis